jgi:hypothetical protein
MSWDCTRTRPRQTRGCGVSRLVIWSSGSATCLTAGPQWAALKSTTGSADPSLGIAEAHPTPLPRRPRLRSGAVSRQGSALTRFGFEVPEVRVGTSPRTSTSRSGVDPPPQSVVPGGRPRDDRQRVLRRRTFTETKAGYLTTEFFLTVIAILARLIATYVDDADLGANEGWK